MERFSLEASLKPNEDAAADQALVGLAVGESVGDAVGESVGVAVGVAVCVDRSAQQWLSAQPLAPKPQS